MTFPQSFIAGGIFNASKGAPAFVSNPARSYYMTSRPALRPDESLYMNYYLMFVNENYIRATTDSQRFREGGSIRCVISGQ